MIQAVRVIDFEMPFGALCVFMTKLLVAALPALAFIAALSWMIVIAIKG